MEYQRYDELPFSPAATEQLIAHANRAFERRLSLLRHPKEALLRRLWNPTDYLKAWPFVGIRMPVDFDFALMLVEVFIPHHIFAVLEQAGDRAALH